MKHLANGDLGRQRTTRSCQGTILQWAELTAALRRSGGQSAGKDSKRGTAPHTLVKFPILPARPRSRPSATMDFPVGVREVARQRRGPPETNCVVTRQGEGHDHRRLRRPCRSTSRLQTGVVEYGFPRPMGCVARHLLLRYDIDRG